MRLSVTFEGEAPASQGPVKVGWLLDDPKGGVLYNPPERVRSVDLDRTHAKSASRCPAIIGLEARNFLVRCPFDINIGMATDQDGDPALRNLASTASSIRGSKLGEKLSLVREVEWRHPGVPTLQLQLPYIFIADEPVFMTQLAPYMHYTPRPWPGTIFGGRFPINVWPRPLMWAFEWYEPDKPLVINRGDPLFYVTFETLPQDRSIQLVEAARTPELLAYIEHISGAVNYVSQTFSLFEAAERSRPETLISPIKR